VLAAITARAQHSNRLLLARLDDLDLDAIRSVLRQFTSVVRFTLKSDDRSGG
jgi:hypothetical protein